MEETSHGFSNAKLFSSKLSKNFPKLPIPEMIEKISFIDMVIQFVELFKRLKFLFYYLKNFLLTQQS